MGGFYGGILIWDELKKVCGRKMSENAKIQRFLGKTRKWYQYQRGVPIPMMQRASGIGTTQTGTGTTQTGTGTTQTGTGTHWQ